MIVSYDWLKDYLSLDDISAAELARRLMLAGLNHEETKVVGDDLAIDLEITSNRPDCLGHIGVAREAAVLFQRTLKSPPATPATGNTPIGELAKVTLACPDLCHRYTARVIRGVKVAASPAWLAQRLTTIGIAPINNVVDITNYVLMECGQPLHAFDLARLDGREIVVRRARSEEPFEAINHTTYSLEPGMCAIADRRRAVAIGGVMGGADTEVSPRTTELLIESAEFAPASIRATARRLNLHSDSSYRFERGLDPQGVDWASRRACEMILDLAGGELAEGVIDVGQRAAQREPVTLRFAQLRRILGIDIDSAEARRILTALGAQETTADSRSVQIIPPTWRRDLTREIDLVEEVARIHGYDAIPEDVQVPMAPSAKIRRDRVLDKVRQALTGAGVDEALTLSVVEQPASDAFTPWTNAPPLRLSMPILRRADLLRRSLIPSLLQARRTNETLSNPAVELFETARIYLPQADGSPREELTLSIVSGRDFLTVKGILETALAALHISASLEVIDFKHQLLSPGRSVELRLNGARFGFLGELSPTGLKQFELRGTATVAEIRISALEPIANLAPQSAELSPYPAVERDLNLVVDEQVHWAQIESTLRFSAGPDLEQLVYRDTYRDLNRLGAGKKSLLFTLVLRKKMGTLTNAEADGVRDAVVAACTRAFDAKLR